jgi:hypothetical protein
MIYFLEFVSEALDEAEAATKYYEEIQPGSLSESLCLGQKLKGQEND